MTTSDENATVSAADAYEVERRRHLLARVQWAALLALGPIALAVPFSLWAFADTAAIRLVLLAVISLVAWPACCSRGTGPPPRPEVLAVLFVLAVATCTGRLILESPEDLDVFVSVVVASMRRRRFSSRGQDGRSSWSRC
jgi:hypothetical protein